MTPPRVLYIVNGFNRGGAETGLRTMLAHGFLQGCDVAILALHEGSPELRLEIEALVKPGCVIVASAGPRLTPIGIVKGFLAIARTLHRFRPHSVVLSLRQANILGRAALIAQPGTHCIAFEHIARLERGRWTWLYAALLTLLSPRVDEVWGDCRSTLTGSQRYYTRRARRERVVPLFVANASETEGATKRDYARGDRLWIATAGRLVARKRVDVLIAALARLRADGQAVQLTVFGEGPERGRLEALASRLGLADAVTFAGFRQTWHRLACDHDLCVHLSDEEGFCIVAAEAMMAGLPLIASPVGGVPEYSTHGRDVLHAPEPDPVAVAALIAELSADEALRRRLGQAAARRIAQLYGRGPARETYRVVTDEIRPARPPEASLEMSGDVGLG